MGLANPWMLAALAALAVPVLMHLVRRAERGGRGFPSLMFVRRIPFEVRHRRQLRDVPLLLLRCLALSLLVMAFAGPYLDQRLVPGANTPSDHDTVILLDRSHSMSHPARWARAVAAAGNGVDGLPAGGRAALVAFDDTATIVQSLTPDRAALRGALAAVEPGRGGTGFAAAFDAANAMLARSTAGRKTVMLVSDLQRSALDAGGALPLSGGAALEIKPVTAPIGANAAVLDARLAAPAGEDAGDSLVVRIRNTGDAPLTDGRIELEVDGRKTESRLLSLAPGAERELVFPVVLARDRPASVTVTAMPDALPADDRYHAVLAPRRPLAVLLAAPESAGIRSGLFLEEALRLARNPRVSVRREPPDRLDEALLEGTDVLVLADAPLPPAAGAAVAAFVDQGGGLLVTAGPAAETRPGALPAPALGPVQSHDGAAVRIDPTARDHSLWRAAGLSDGGAFPAARVTASRRLEPGTGDRVLARLDDGTPLLIARAAGAGRVLALATAADPQWGSLVLEPAFVPFMQAAVHHLAGTTRWYAAYTAGQVVDLVSHAGSLPGGREWRRYLLEGGTVVVEDPTGAGTRLSGAPGDALFTSRLAGIHEAHRADGRGGTLPFAVNTDRAESLLAAAELAEVEGRVTRRPVPAETAGDVGTDDMTTEAGWWLVLLALIVLLAESAHAGRAARRRAQAA